MQDFLYLYDNRHWEVKKRAKKNLEKLAREDGWSGLASVEIQLLNRRIDSLAALFYFQDLIPGDIHAFERETISRFKLSQKKRIYLRIQFLIRFFTFWIFRGGHFLQPSNNRQLEFTVKQNQITLIRLLLISTKIKTSEDLLPLISRFREIVQDPLLEKRFQFWELSFNHKIS
jgi:hypothetical protein